MRAYVIDAHGGSEALRLSHRPLPEPGPGEARLRVLAVSLNHLDLWVRRGVPGHRFPLPIIPGCDVAGEISALGPGPSRWKLGQRVLLAPGIGCGACAACHAGRDHLCRYFGIFGETRDGGCAEEMVAPQSHLLPIPQGLSPAEAAATPLTLLTAWHMLVSRAEVRPGESVLVQAGASGVGIMAIQIAVLWGAEVFATAGSPAKADLARSLGAREVILYRQDDFVEEIRRLTGKRGVDVVIDSIGADVFERSVRILAKGGRLVTCGATAGPEARLDLRVLFFRALSVLGSTMGSRGELEEAFSFVASGRIRPVVDQVFPMEELARAHERLESREALGKVVAAGFGVDPKTITVVGR
jgi:NADPH:quinone reductase-like Zn-dependent oxidoreductase